VFNELPCRVIFTIEPKRSVIPIGQLSKERLQRVDQFTTEHGHLMRSRVLSPRVCHPGRFQALSKYP
jgi:hypothetical protein